MDLVARYIRRIPEEDSAMSTSATLYSTRMRTSILLKFNVVLGIESKSSTRKKYE